MALQGSVKNVLTQNSQIVLRKWNVFNPLRVFQAFLRNNNNIYLAKIYIWKMDVVHSCFQHQIISFSDKNPERWSANIWGTSSNFVDCGSFLESNSLDILALCETNLDDSIDSGNFSVRGYLPLIRKDSSTHIRKLCRFLLMFSTGFTSLSVLLLFPLSITFFVFVHSFSFYVL